MTMGMGLIFIFFFVVGAWGTGSCYVGRLVWNLLCNSGWPPIHDLPASASPALGSPDMNCIFTKYFRNGERRGPIGCSLGKLSWRRPLAVFMDALQQIKVIKTGTGGSRL
jgi:hypothetical protein